MNCKVMFSVNTLLLCLALSPTFTLAQSPTSPLSTLPGRWSGQATLYYADNSKETMHCTSTYFVEGSSVRQNIRCSNSNNNISLRSRLSISGVEVRGQWEEEKYGIRGQANGKMAAAGFDLRIQSDTFNARMAVRTQARRQTVDIEAVNSAVRRILISMSK